LHAIGHEYLFKDEDSLTAWLNERPEAVRQNCAMFIAARSALRVLPIAVDGFQFTDAQIQSDIKTTVILQSLLMASRPAEKITRTFPAMTFDAPPTFGLAHPQSGYSAVAAFRAVLAAEVAASEASVVASHAVNAAHTAASIVSVSLNVISGALWIAVREDCQLWWDNSITNGYCRIDIAPLGLEGIRIAPDWPVVREKLLNDTDPERGADWSFWVEWYDKILRGDPQNWDMLYEIAVSQDIDWEATPRKVNAAIARIVEKHRLLREIADLKAQRDQLASFTASAEMRSHNMPPELVDADARVTQSIQIIWDTIDEAEEELREEKPEPSRLKKLGEVLLRATAEVIRYCGQKADIMVTEAAKKIGAAGGVAAASLLASQTEAAQKIGNGLVEFAKLLLGG